MKRKLIILFFVFATFSFFSCAKKNDRTFALRLVADQSCPLAAVLEVVSANSDLVSLHRLFLPTQNTRDFQQIEKAVSAGEADAALVPAGEAALLLGANPDWRLLADFGPTRRLVLLAINSTATTPPGVINFAGDEGRLAFAVWRAGAAEALLKKTELRAAPPNIRPQYLLLNDALMIVAEPLDERLAARPGLRTVAGLDEHLLLLVRRDFLRRHGQLVERLLDVLCETPAAALADATRLLARIAVALNATPQWTREQIVGLSFGGAGEAACRKSVRPGDATRRQLDAFVAAGKQAGLVRREFSLDSALK